MMVGMRSKNWLLVPALLIVASGSVLAAQTRSLDLESAIQMAVGRNLELQVAELNLHKAELEYEKSKAQNLLTSSLYNESAAENILLMARSTYHNTRYQVVTETLTQYAKVWLATLDKQIKAKKVELEVRLLVDARAQYAIGDIGSVELLERENALNNARFSLETAQDDYGQDIREFAATLGLTETELVLSALQFRGGWQVIEAEALRQALKNSLDLVIAEKKQKLAEIDAERAAVSAAKLDQELKQTSLELAQLTTAQTVTEITNQTLESYYQLHQAAKKVGLSEEALGEAREKYAAMQKQYAAGLVTQTEVLEYEANLDQAEYGYLSAIAEYYQKELALRQRMNLEPGVFTNETK